MILNDTAGLRAHVEEIPQDVIDVMFWLLIRAMQEAEK